MTRTQSHRLLADLRRQLSRLEFNDPQAREKAVHLIEHIDRSMEQEKWDEADRNELRQHLKDSVMYFEVSHPVLTTAINNIINTLNMLGI
jgi:hypothetical protein